MATAIPEKNVIPESIGQHATWLQVAPARLCGLKHVRAHLSPPGAAERWHSGDARPVASPRLPCFSSLMVVTRLTPLQHDVRSQGRENKETEWGLNGEAAAS